MNARWSWVVCLIICWCCVVDCWWIWGDESEENVEGDQIDVIDDKNENAITADATGDVISEAADTNVHNINRDNVKIDEKDAVVGTPEIAKKLDREAFEKKLEEVIKAHEDIHLNKEVHFDGDGEHNDDFDHEVQYLYQIFYFPTGFPFRHFLEMRQKSFAI